MKNGNRGFWTIEKLAARAAEALSVGYGGVPSSRVRDVPDLRTIRYYTTLGLLDRPAAMLGRTALYGSRHLLQLVAIKHLQAQGLSLAAVQQRVLGLSNAALRRIAEALGPERDVRPTASRGDSFGRLAARTPANHGKGAAFASAPFRAESEQPAQQAVRAEIQTLRLGDGLLLLLTGRRAVDEEDLRSIRAAAASLIEVLKLRGMIDTDVDTEAKKPGDPR
jgi:DNA-binding transcriptional MerR regulator